MRVTVLLFARYREAASAASVDIDVPAGATLAQVWERVIEQVPALGSGPAPLLACNRVYARPDLRLSGGEEIAAFPPVSGG